MTATKQAGWQDARERLADLEAQSPDRELALALSSVEEAKQAAASAEAAVSANRQEYAALVPQTNAAVLARSGAVADLHRAYHAKLKELRAALDKASKANAELADLYRQAERQFRGPLLDDAKFPAAAGLPDLAWPELADTSKQTGAVNRSRLEYWRRDADACLSATPPAPSVPRP